MRVARMDEFPAYEFWENGTVWSQYRRGARRVDGVPVVLESKFKLAGTINEWGYTRLTLRDRSDRKRDILLHRAMLEAFVGPCPQGMEACHKDGNKRNNSLSNLRWDTPASNQADRLLHGTHQLGEHGPRAKLTMLQVRKARLLWDTGNYTQTQLAKMYGVTGAAMHRIVHGKTYKEING